MANMMMSSSKVLITSSSSTIPPSPRFKLSLTQIPFPKLPLPKSPISLETLSIPSTFKSISVILASSLAMAPPSLAEEIEKASLFDFNLTLPIMMAEFLFLMFALDKIYFSPLGKFMDERDSAIKEKLSSVKDTSAEVKQLEEQAAAIMKAARAEISAALNKMKKETQLEVEQKIAEGRKKVEAELQEALASLESQKEETIKSLDSQIAALSDEIVKKVLPVTCMERHFCLSCDGGIRIKDGDKLTFMRHVSISYNLVKTRLKREDPHEKEPSIPKGCESRHWRDE